MSHAARRLNRATLGRQLLLGREPPAEGRDESVQRLVRRYLEAFGPATAADVAQFSLLTRSVARDALRGLAGELEGPDGAGLFDVPGGAAPGRGHPRSPGCCPCGTASCSPTPTAAG
jgi:hypothetical protein